jgi:hypothetical protein
VKTHRPFRAELVGMNLSGWLHNKAEPAALLGTFSQYLDERTPANQRDSSQLMSMRSEHLKRRVSALRKNESIQLEASDRSAESYRAPLKVRVCQEVHAQCAIDSAAVIRASGGHLSTAFLSLYNENLGRQIGSTANAA